MQKIWQLIVDIFSHDDQCDEVLLNGPFIGFKVKNGEYFPIDSFFLSVDEMEEWLQDFAIHQGKRLDPHIPAMGGSYYLNMSLRWHGVLKCLSPLGPLLSVRRHRFDTLDLHNFGNYSLFSESLKQAYELNHNFIFFGETGSGKSSLMFSLLSHYSKKERLVFMETLDELPMLSPHWIKLLEKQPHLDGKGGFDLIKLVKESLRLRPDRLIIGEVRNEEALALMHLLQVGHKATLTTIHASTPKMICTRLINLCNSSPVLLETLEQNASRILTVGLKRGNPPNIDQVEYLPW